MICRRFQDLRLSALGMGAMRLPVLDGDDARINEAQTFRMVDTAMAGGVNYYDTAWGYHDGHSELVLGRALARYPRDSFYLADKFPGYDLGNFGKVEEIFEEQLRKCGVDRFDFYLFHNVCELNIEQYLDDARFKTYSCLMEQKRRGRIRHLGFSAHGSAEVIRRFLEAYGKDMEFCQLQLNWLDWEFQGGKEKAALLREWNIPIWVMEPLRGGKLASLPEEDAAMLRSFRPRESVPGWAFRFLQGIPGVTVILSGMSDEAQLADNLRTFETDEPLKEEEASALLALAAKMTRRTALPCTACRYCTSHCPQGLNIPWLLELYNEHVFTGGGFLAPMALMSLPEDKKPSACIGCRSCEQVCPQQIRISEAMKDFCGKL
ncbi:MAG: aldo/keto reductase [Oscillospiraceae bacterium]|nr:aldo/keto reductase [Oscillospiraceae bacterium]